MISFLENLLSQPIYFEIHKDVIFAKWLRTGNTYEGELFIWKHHDPDKGDITVSIGPHFTPLNQTLAHISEDQTQKQKIFYNKGDLVVGDFESAQTAMSHIFSTRLSKDTSTFIRPVIIFNTPPDLTQVELRVLRDLGELVGGRACFVISEPSRPMEHQLKNLDQQNFNFLSRPGEYASNKKLVFIFLLMFTLAVLTLGLHAMGIINIFG